MSYLGQILSLASSVTFTLLFSGMAVTAMANGRLKVEPNQPWLVFRDHPFKFVVVVAIEAYLAVMFGVVSVRIASVMLSEPIFAEIVWGWPNKLAIFLVSERLVSSMSQI